MDATSALTGFLSSALRHRKRRYIGFISSQKAQGKFLAAISHDLESDLDKELRIRALPNSVATMTGYRFSPPSEFGTPISNLLDESDAPYGDFLVISTDGKVGIHFPEGKLDGSSIYQVKSNAL